MPTTDPNDTATTITLRVNLTQIEAWTRQLDNRVREFRTIALRSAARVTTAQYRRVAHWAEFLAERIAVGRGQHSGAKTRDRFTKTEADAAALLHSIDPLLAFGVRRRLGR